MAKHASIPGIPSADITTPDEVVAKPVKVIHPDGTTETVYLIEILPDDKNGKKQHLRDHLLIAYILIGTIALAFSAYLGYRQIKNNK